MQNAAERVDKADHVLASRSLDKDPIYEARGSLIGELPLVHSGMLIALLSAAHREDKKHKTPGFCKIAMVTDDVRESC